MDMDLQQLLSVIAVTVITIALIGFIFYKERKESDK